VVSDVPYCVGEVVGVATAARASRLSSAVIALVALAAMLAPVGTVMAWGVTLVGVPAESVG